MQRSHWVTDLQHTPVRTWAFVISAGCLGGELEGGCTRYTF